LEVVVVVVAVAVAMAAAVLKFYSFGKLHVKADHFFLMLFFLINTKILKLVLHRVVMSVKAE
jgi:hypothetical protein